MYIITSLYAVFSISFILVSRVNLDGSDTLAMQKRLPTQKFTILYIAPLWDKTHTAFTGNLFKSMCSFASWHETQNVDRYFFYLRFLFIYNG